MTSFISIPEAIDELKRGNMLIIVDNPNRENQGDLIFPAEVASKEKVNFMIKYCRGFVCTPITRSRALELNLPLMVASEKNTERTRVNFTVSVDSKNVKSFGISAADRSLTIQTIVNPHAHADDLVRPGHVFPLVAEDAGVLTREGHTEATVDLVSLSGFAPCGVLCEILRSDGSVAKLPDLERFADKYSVKIVSITDLVAYRRKHRIATRSAKTVIKVSSASLPTQYGTFQLSIYKSILDGREHVLLKLGKTRKKTSLVRIHSSCFTGDTLMSLKCDCRKQLHKSMQMIQARGEGVILYLNQEGRGIGLSAKIRAYNLQDAGFDTVEANTMIGFHPDGRDYKIAAEILKETGILQVILLTNNPSKVKQLSDYGIKVLKKISLEVTPNKFNKIYLSVKKQKLKHHLTLV